MTTVRARPLRRILQVYRLKRWLKPTTSAIAAVLLLLGSLDQLAPSTLNQKVRHKARRPVLVHHQAPCYYVSFHER